MRTVLREAERPRRKLFEPEGRVFAAAAKRALETSKSGFEPAKSFPGTFPLTLLARFTVIFTPEGKTLAMMVKKP
jgi:hypothetical protein